MLSIKFWSVLEGLQSLCTVLENAIVGMGGCKKVNTVNFKQDVLSMDKSIHGREGGCYRNFMFFLFLFFLER